MTIDEFVDVVAGERAQGGLILSTSGFSGPALESITKIERERVEIKGRQKVVSLCRTFERLNAGLWSPPTDLAEVIYSDEE